MSRINIYYFLLLLNSLIIVQTSCKKSTEHPVPIQETLSVYFEDFGFDNQSILAHYDLPVEDSILYVYCSLKNDVVIRNLLFKLPRLGSTFSRKRICRKDSSIFYQLNGSLYKYFFNSKENTRLFESIDSSKYFSIWDFSPNFETVLLTSNIYGNSDLYSLSYDGKELKNLTNDTVREYFPEFSLDGSKIVYQTNYLYNNTKEPPNIEIFSINIDGSNKKNLSNIPSNITESHEFPSYSNDGSKILYIRLVNSDREGIYLMNSDGSNKIKLIDYSVYKFYGRAPGNNLEGLSWTKDNNYIYFQEDFSDRTFNIKLPNNIVIQSNYCDIYQSSYSKRFNRYSNNIVYSNLGVGSTHSICICINNFQKIILVSDSIINK